MQNSFYELALFEANCLCFIIECIKEMHTELGLSCWNKTEALPSMNGFLYLFRILKTSAVSGQFEARYAKERTYLYRFAVRKLKGSFPFPSDYIHDWSDVYDEIQAAPMRSRGQRRSQKIKLWGLGNMLPLTEEKYVSEIRYLYFGMLQLRAGAL